MLALFAETALPPLTWAAVAVTVSTTIGLIATSYFALLGSRDRVRLDAVEERLTECEEHKKRCEGESAAAKKTLARMRAKKKPRRKPRPRR